MTKRVKLWKLLAIFSLMIVPLMIFNTVCAETENETRFPYLGEGIISRSKPGELTGAALIEELSLIYWDTTDGYLVLDEEYGWTVKAQGGDGKLSYQYTVYYQPLNSQDDWYTPLEVRSYSASNAFHYIPSDEGRYFIKINVRDDAGAVLEYSTHSYSTSDPEDISDPTTLRGKVEQLKNRCIAEAGGSDYSRALWMHDWLINNANYDYTFTRYQPEGVLLYGSGVCQSYAIAYELLLDALNIDVLYVTGDADGAHAWNMVKLDGEWYHVDCTWDDPNSGGYETRTYFGLTDAMIQSDHRWDIENDGKYPACAATKYNYDTHSGTFSLDENAVTVSVGQTYRLTVSTAYADQRTIVWDTDDHSIVTIDENGVLLAISPGNAIVNVTNASGVLASCTVTVTDLPTGITLQRENASLTVGSDAQAAEITLIASVIPENLVDTTVTWESENEDVATVDASGHVKALRAGTTRIAASTVNGITAYCTLFVSEHAVIDNLIVRIESGEVTVLGWNAESSYYDAQPLVIPQTLRGYPVISIAANAFRNKYFASISLPEGLQYIEDDAFFSSVCPTAIHIPASVREIGTYAFSYMQSVPAFTVSPGNRYYRAIDGVLYDKGVTRLIHYPLGSPRTEFHVPSSVTLLYCTSFAHAKNLTAIYVPSKTVRAMTYTFYGLTLTVYGVSGTNLQEQIEAQMIDGDVTFALITGYAYPTSIQIDPAQCPLALNSTNPADKQILFSAAVQPDNAQNKTVIWTSGAEDIARVDDTGLVTALAVGRAVITGTTINGKTSTCEILVSEVVNSISLDREALTLYLTGYDAFSCARLFPAVTPEGCAITWESSDETVATVLDGLICIHGAGDAVIRATNAYGSMADCRLTVEEASVTALPASLQSIEKNAFCNAQTLSHIYIPGTSLLKIGENAFSGCTSLKMINLPDCVTGIGAGAFTGCPLLIVYCESGSAAHTYAQENGIDYLIID